MSSDLAQLKAAHERLGAEAREQWQRFNDAVERGVRGVALSAMNAKLNSLEEELLDLEDLLRAHGWPGN